MFKESTKETDKSTSSQGQSLPKRVFSSGCFRIILMPVPCPFSVYTKDVSVCIFKSVRLSSTSSQNFKLPMWANTNIVCRKLKAISLSIIEVAWTTFGL